MRNRLRLFRIGLAAMAAASPTSAFAQPAEPAPVVDLGGGSVAFVPTGVAVGSQAPVMVLLHGAGGRPQAFIRLFTPEAQRRGVVLVAVGSRGATWDMIEALKRAAQRGEDAGGSAPDMSIDGPRITAALKTVSRCIAAGAAHTAIAGFSDGASYALTVGVADPGRYRTILAFSPGVAVLTAPPDPRQRLFIAHGRQDPVLPFAERANDLVPALREAGGNVTFRPFDGTHEVPPAVIASGFDLFLQDIPRAAQSSQPGARDVSACLKS